MALFASKDDNRLRMYALSRVRAVLNSNPNEETGNEIWPDKEVLLPKNPAWSQPTAQSFAFGMAVDGTRVYVALGMQGLVRVSFCHFGCPVTVTGGPYFGDDSHYHQTISGDYAGVYGNYEHIATDGVVSTPKNVLLSHPPYFLDVAIEHDDGKSYLWAAVDHVGLVRFVVTQPNAWSSTMPIDHQEGEKITNAEGEEQIRLVRLVTPQEDQTTGELSSVTMRTYAHRVSIVEVEGDRRVLAAAVLGEPYLLSNGLLDEGRRVDHLIGTDRAYSIPYGYTGPDVWGAKPYSLLYDLDELQRHPPQTPATGEAYNHTVLLKEIGGRRALLAQEPPTDEVVFLGATRGFGAGATQANFLARYDWPSLTLLEMPQRMNEDRPGRHGSDVGFLGTNPEVILTAGNDDGLPADGILTLCPDGFHRDYYSGGGNGNDPRALFGIVFNAFSVWPGVTGHDFVLGAGREFATTPQTDPGRARWMLVDFKAGANLCTGSPSPPDREKRIYVESPPDRFGAPGRGWYIGGSIDLGYDAHLQTLPGVLVDKLALVTRDKTPDGLVVLDRGRLEGALLNSMTDGFLLESPNSLYPFLDDLDTHPEFAGISDPTAVGNFMTVHNLAVVVTHFPHFLQVSGPEGQGSGEHWIVVAGAGAVYFPPELVDLYPTYAPAAEYQTFYEHSLVRVFDVHDPEPMLDQNRSTQPASYSLIGPSYASGAYRVEPFEWGGRDYLAVADLGGAVQLWDLTDLLDPSTPEIIHPDLDPTVTDYGTFMLEEWRTPDCVSDDYPNTVWSIAVDLADTGGNEDPDVVHIYALVGRVGIEVLEFDPTASPGNRLAHLEHIETPSGSGGIRIRDLGPGETDLLMLERDTGLRAFERP